MIDKALQRLNRWLGPESIGCVVPIAFIIIVFASIGGVIVLLMKAGGCTTF